MANKANSDMVLFMVIRKFKIDLKLLNEYVCQLLRYSKKLELTNQLGFFYQLILLKRDLALKKTCNIQWSTNAILADLNRYNFGRNDFIIRPMISINNKMLVQTKKGSKPMYDILNT